MTQSQVGETAAVLAADAGIGYVAATRGLRTEIAIAAALGAAAVLGATGILAGWTTWAAGDAAVIPAALAVADQVRRLRLAAMLRRLAVYLPAPAPPRWGRPGMAVYARHRCLQLDDPTASLLA